MKKIFFALVAVIMMFSVVGCGNNNPSKENTAEKKVIEQYMGEWKANSLKSRLDNEITYQVATITLKEDGTCIYKGESAKWEYIAELNQFVFTLDKNGVNGTLEIAEENGKTVLKYVTETYYRPEDFVAKNTEYVGATDIITDDAPTDNSQDTSIDTKKSKEITITFDNWNEYFEIIEHPQWKENAFGEIDSVTVFWTICLKEEYQNCVDINKLSSVSFGLTSKYNLYGIQVDYTSCQYSYLDCLTKFEAETESTTIKFDFSKQLSSDKTKINYIELFNSDVWDAKTSDNQDVQAIYKYYDIEVQRVEGIICLYED